MSSPHLNLVVLRVSDLERAATFYRAAGLEFVRHAHGKGPEHYASENAGVVFELYPATAKVPSAPGMRIGFRVDSADHVAAALVQHGGELVTPPADTEWGRRAVVKDLDGHVIELVTPRPA